MNHWRFSGVYGPMSFTPHKPNLNADALKAVQEAFDLAWVEIASMAVGCDGQTARNVTRKRIIQAVVETGERDPVRLVAYALQAFKKRS